MTTEREMREELVAIAIHALGTQPDMVLTSRRDLHIAAVAVLRDVVPAHERYLQAKIATEAHGETTESDPRLFQLVRHEDETGVSGEGVVVEGVVFSDGHAAIHWTGSKWPTTTPHPGGIEAVLEVHGHDGKTILEWLDREAPAEAEIERWAAEIAAAYRAAKATGCPHGKTGDLDHVSAMGRLTAIGQLMERLGIPTPDAPGRAGEES